MFREYLGKKSPNIVKIYNIAKNGEVQRKEKQKPGEKPNQKKKRKRKK